MHKPNTGEDSHRKCVSTATTRCTRNRADDALAKGLGPLREATYASRYASYHDIATLLSRPPGRKHQGRGCGLSSVLQYSNCGRCDLLSERQAVQITVCYQRRGMHVHFRTRSFPCRVHCQSRLARSHRPNYTVLPFLPPQRQGQNPKMRAKDVAVANSKPLQSAMPLCARQPNPSSILTTSSPQHV